MKERSIIFSAPMVRAILSGAKTQTRRVVKNCRQLRDWDSSPSDAYDVEVENGEAMFLVAGDHGFTDWIPCPYGAPGDRLWVRETWATGIVYDAHKPSSLAMLIDNQSQPAIAYGADWKRVWAPEDHGRWRPSIHMPRWASRITLDVLAVRVERLQEISEEDAEAEGVDPDFGNAYTDARNDHRRAYGRLWDSINGKRAPWASNPWVWVIEFLRAQP